MAQIFDQDLAPGTTAMMAILLILCIGYVVVASMLIHGARKVNCQKKTTSEMYVAPMTFGLSDFLLILLILLMLLTY